MTNPEKKLKTKKVGKNEVTVVEKLKKDPSWRPIMFSRNTAMFTIPTEVRDKAGLVDMYYKGLGAIITYNESSNCIEIKLGTARPLPNKD